MIPPLKSSTNVSFIENEEDNNDNNAEVSLRSIPKCLVEIYAISNRNRKRNKEKKRNRDSEVGNSAVSVTNSIGTLSSVDEKDDLRGSIESAFDSRQLHSKSVDLMNLTSEEYNSIDYFQESSSSIDASAKGTVRNQV